MNRKFVYQVGNNKKNYTMMHGQPNIKMSPQFCTGHDTCKSSAGNCDKNNSDAGKDFSSYLSSLRFQF